MPLRSTTIGQSPELVPGLGSVPPEGPAPVLLVSSAGGHFVELVHAADRAGVGRGDRWWAVPRSPQTESALADERVIWFPRLDSGARAATLGALPRAVALHRLLAPREVLSTGAAQAVPHLLAAAMCRTPIRFVESAARHDGPSATGRLAARLPRTETEAPVPGWGARWHAAPDVFSDYAVTPRPPGPSEADVAPSPRRVVVALGTEVHPFPRAVRLVAAALPADAVVTWQVGRTTIDVDGAQPQRWLRPDDLRAAMREADAVVVHAGVGSVLDALECGHVPVVVPRYAARGEHVDDHQPAMAARLALGGLVVPVASDEVLSAAHLRRAMSSRVTRRTSAGTAL